MTSRIPTVSLLSFVTLFYSTLLMGFKANTRYRSCILFFGDTKTVYCKKACWDDGHKQTRGYGKSEKIERIESRKGSLRYVMCFDGSLWSTGQQKRRVSDCEQTALRWGKRSKHKGFREQRVEKMANGQVQQQKRREAAYKKKHCRKEWERKKRLSSGINI